jgi:8-oxo-dGTP diphosphatase
VDTVIHDPERGVVLVRRKNPPLGWALPGGFVDYGECVEHAAVREAREETRLAVELTGLLGVYSDPARDARTHTVSAVFTARARNPEEISGGDDAAEAKFFPLDALPRDIVFDHRTILDDFMARRKSSPA